MAAARFAAAAMECEAQSGQPCVQCRQLPQGAGRTSTPMSSTVQDPDHWELPVDLLPKPAAATHTSAPTTGPRKVYIFPDCDALNRAGPERAAEAGGGGAALRGVPVLRGERRRRCCPPSAPGAWSGSSGRRGRGRPGRRRPGPVPGLRSGQLLPVSQYLAGLENERHRAGGAAAAAGGRLAGLCRGAAGRLRQARPCATVPERRKLRSGGLDKCASCMRTTDLLEHYRRECRYNVGVGHVLGALCAGWESCFDIHGKESTL